MTKRTPGPDPFNNPFSKVKLADEKKPEPGKKPPPPPPPRKEKPPALDAEAALFLEAMGEVVPVKADHKRAPVADAAPRPDPVKVLNEDSESLAQLAELVAGDGPFELDGAEGRVPGFDAQVMKRLRTGGFPVHARLDLHGMTRDKGQGALEAFVAQARRDGQRCVLVITGRGLNSEDQISVLRESLPQWLTRGRLGRQVLAFCPARPADGGPGAAYVLLRR